MKILLAAAAFVAAGLTMSNAASLRAPEGPVVLTVTGNVENANSEAGAVFDRSMLDEIEGRAATLETPWIDDPAHFEGPFLKAVLDAAGAQGGKIVVRALNDYAAEVPMEDATELATILATRLDGKPMSVRDKGPLFLIYPFDTHPELYNEKYFARSVWQIREIEVVD